MAYNSKSCIFHPALCLVLSSVDTGGEKLLDWEIKSNEMLSQVVTLLSDELEVATQSNPCVYIVVYIMTAFFCGLFFSK